MQKFQSQNNIIIAILLYQRGGFVAKTDLIRQATRINAMSSPVAWQRSGPAFHRTRQAHGCSPSATIADVFADSSQVAVQVAFACLDAANQRQAKHHQGIACWLGHGADGKYLDRAKGHIRMGGIRFAVK